MDQRQNSWAPDWDRMAQRIIRDGLRLQPGERVVYLADPWEFPNCLDAFRAAVLSAGGVEQATILNWTPRLSTLRGMNGKAKDVSALLREQQAHFELLNTADVFIWLPHAQFREGSYSEGESEWILGRWRGRGIHFHWFADAGTPPGDPIHVELEKIYQRGILDLDYVALRTRQRRLVEAIRGKTVRVRTGEGTNVSFRLPKNGWYHCNDGDASREKVLRAVCARDREEEFPCGAVRSLPAPDSVNGTIRLRGRTPWTGFGLDVDRFSSHLDLAFKDGHITEMDGGQRNDELQEIRSKFEGDWDRLGEVVFGTNPLLPTPQGARMPTYWGFGEGWFRFHIGESLESGGSFTSNLYLNLFLGDATIEAEGEPVIENGRLLI
ncbi:MAG TPA: hypothetical protein VLV31_06465 [Candidatus Acidoferrales bacterium]|nr:hypothetical protein [Candidatus Acidoferrales bacterium]